MNRYLRGIRVIAVLLWLAAGFAGCVIDDNEVKAEAQALGLSCKVFRPVTWIGFAATCREAVSPSVLVLPDGATFEAVSSGGPGLGVGNTTLLCNNGTLETIENQCAPGHAGE